jgi:symplekin
MEEKARRAAPKRTAVAGPSSDATPDAKRSKVDHPPASASFLASFDFTSLPGSMVTEFIVNSIGALSESQLTDLVNAYKRSRPTETAGIPAIPATPAPTPAAPAAGPSRPPPTAPVAMVKARSQSNEPVSVPVKDEPADPLAMNIDNDEMDYEPDRLNQEVSETFAFFAL